MKNIAKEIRVPGPSRIKFVTPKRGRGRPRKNGHGDMALISSLPQVIFVGNFTLAQHANHNLWLTAPGGEAMQVDPVKLEKAIRAFYRKNF